MSEEKTCVYCGEEIGMDDYRVYCIVQVVEERAHFVYVHSICQDMDEDHPIFKKILEGGK